MNSQEEDQDQGCAAIAPPGYTISAAALALVLAASPEFRYCRFSPAAM